MALISNQLDGLYGGVNQQSAEHRLPTQVEEMVNAYPTLDRGLLKRNPTQKLALSSSVNFAEEIWSYAYDRGLSGSDEEKYVINVTSGEMEIINVLNGQVYKEGDGLTISQSGKDYLFPFSGMNGYAATTIKDTTFIVNKAAMPLPVDQSLNGDTAPVVVNMKTASIGVLSYTLSDSPNGTFARPAPYVYGNASARWDMYHGYTTIVVDGQTIIVFSIHPEPANLLWRLLNGTHAMWSPYERLSYSSYITNMVSKLTSSLGSGYIVSLGSDSNIKIKKLDGTDIAVSISITGKNNLGVTKDIVDSNFIGSITYSNADEDQYAHELNYKKEGYIWLKSSNPVNAYTYTASIIDKNNNSVSTSATATTTTAAATALAASISANANFTAVASGSVIKITGTNELKSVDASDTWGNQASFGWQHKVQFDTDLPKNLGFSGAVVKITGSATGDFATYWLKYENSLWQESKDPEAIMEIEGTSMPHILTRNADDTFTFDAYTGWKDGLVGDIASNPIPSFMTDNNTIKDIFFFKNRLGFITDRTCLFSEVGEYGNFWRTTTAAVLDSDYIDTTVDTTKAISLEYATYLEDSILLFSDKSQFRVEGGKVLSPKDIQISQTSAYEININVRPLFMNNKIFFCSNRGDYTALMQYDVKPVTSISEAIDITAHVQSYIPKRITTLSGNPINNMLFITSPEDKGAIWVYKYYDNGADRVQSSWFKWTYNGSIYSAFSLGRNLNLMISRTNPVATTNWVVGTGVWDSSKLWDDAQKWVMSDDSLSKQNQFETSPIFPQAHTSNFLDDFTTEGNETIIPTVVKIGEWIQGGKYGKDIRGHLKFKTVKISSEEGSEFDLIVEDVARSTTRTIKSKYTVNRQPMVYGDAKNIRISITNSDEAGFRINTVSYEGTLTKRDSRR